MIQLHPIIRHYRVWPTESLLKSTANGWLRWVKSHGTRSCQCCDQHCMHKGGLTYKHFKILRSFWGCNLKAGSFLQRPARSANCRLMPRQGVPLLHTKTVLTWRHNGRASRRYTHARLEKAASHSMVRGVVKSFSRNPVNLYKIKAHYSVNKSLLLDPTLSQHLYIECTSKWVKKSPNLHYAIFGYLSKQTASYVVGHERVCNILFLCIVSILWVLIILSRECVNTT
jgi:hypothetical protein